jgi:hypothetical protein
MTEELAPGLRVFLSPTIFHLAGVLAICLAVNVPISRSALGVVLVALGVLGIAYASRVLLHFARYKFEVGVDDRILYGVAPLPCYGLIIASGALLYAHVSLAPFLLAAAVLLLILVCIRNAWDITVWAVIRAPNK